MVQTPDAFYKEGHGCCLPVEVLLQQVILEVAAMRYMHYFDAKYSYVSLEC